MYTNLYILYMYIIYNNIYIYILFREIERERERERESETESTERRAERERERDRERERERAERETDRDRGKLLSLCIFPRAKPALMNVIEMRGGQPHAIDVAYPDLHPVPYLLAGYEATMACGCHP